MSVLATVSVVASSAAYAGLGAVVLITLLLVGARWTAAAIYRSILPLPPTAKMDEEKLDAHALFRHFPQLKGKIAWRQLGKYPTPVHTVTTTAAGGATIKFSVKREDLASAQYGGNKLRTLQHQLAACEAHLEAHPAATLTLIGSYGSNQVVATKVHAQQACGIPPGTLQACSFLPDKPDFDNTLNLLSSLSFGGRVVLTPLAGLKTILSSLWGTTNKVFAPGGHNVTGVLGQIGACLELAEQIERGDASDPTAIFLPYGSGCTTTGLVIGVALSRRLGLRAFRQPGFKIVACIVHHAFAFLHVRTATSV